MKSIAWVNVEVPADEGYVEYGSGDSLRDYDIVVFDPEIPYYSRIEFGGGGSCISIEGSEAIEKASSHWFREITDALAVGKSVFVVLSAYEEDQAATNYTPGPKGARNYQTKTINNYAAVPEKFQVRNARGRRIVTKDAAFKSLYGTIKEITEYRVVFEPPLSIRTAFAAKDGAALGGVVKSDRWAGSLVLLPYFGFTADEFIELDSQGDGAWTKKALDIFQALAGQLVSLDRTLRSSADHTPPPAWLGGLPKPMVIDVVENTIGTIDARINELRHQRDKKSRQLDDLKEYSRLLYENGHSLESAIEKVLRLLGYTVETLRSGDLEIDHVIVGPSGIRMIGESEGKDNSAIDISKFRQLESNIGEDFERDDVEKPAKGILFGNGYRLSPPHDRAEQFTQKCLINAARLGSALVRTSDLYYVAHYLLDHPDDESFRSACRNALEVTVGGIVQFPDI
ncbi:hypothetical protein [Aurantimonas sp. VKM B-3413]|uniref:hypothetical protein n=1 Tax=Aurantimonas sp. VKM B-3413 TaxID=2779401 RepID=UPI001E50AA91|nr:hypothetical protein [Aurantimonas sp. VKM B-3413]MCB8838083.1 hypothetical protein [Aurantimonas sp. VKM B-3413]